MEANSWLRNQKGLRCGKNLVISIAIMITTPVPGKTIYASWFAVLTGAGIGTLTQVKGANNSEKYVSVLVDNLIPVITEK